MRGGFAHLELGKRSGADGICGCLGKNALSVTTLYATLLPTDVIPYVLSTELGEASSNITVRYQNDIGGNFIGY